jgi:hypothetical protein
MRRAALAAALVLALGAGTIAVAQHNGDSSPENPGSIAEEKSAFGQCVADASQSGIEDPDEFCADQRPDGENGNGNGGENGNGDGEGNRPFAEECGDLSKEDGSFGECVAEHASAFGQCVSANAQAGVVNPAAACASLQPGNGQGVNGPPEGVPNGPPGGVPNGPPEGVPNGPPEGVPNGRPEQSPDGKPEGTPSGPPEGVPGGPPEGVPDGPPG